MVRFKSVVCLSMILGVLVSGMDVARAADASSGGFVPVAPEDSAQITHYQGRFVTNRDTVSPRNVVTSLGIASAATNSGSQYITYHINAFREAGTPTALVCWVILTSQTNPESELPVASVQWNQGETSAKNISYNLQGGTWYATAFCAIPKKMTSGETGSKVYGVWATSG